MILESLRSDLAGAVPALRRPPGWIDTVGAEMAALELGVRHDARRMIALERNAVGLARTLYIGGMVDGLEGLLTTRDLGDIETRLEYLESSSEAHVGTFTRLAADRAALNHRLDDLDAKRARLVAAAEELNDLRAAIAEGIAEQEAEVAAIDAAVLAAAQDIVSHPAPSITPPVPSGPLAPTGTRSRCARAGATGTSTRPTTGDFSSTRTRGSATAGAGTRATPGRRRREQQIAIAEKVLDAQGPGAWPHCFQWAS